MQRVQYITLTVVVDLLEKGIADGSDYWGNCPHKCTATYIPVVNIKSTQ